MVLLSPSVTRRQTFLNVIPSEVDELRMRDTEHDE